MKFPDPLPEAYFFPINAVLNELGKGQEMGFSRQSDGSAWLQKGPKSRKIKAIYSPTFIEEPEPIFDRLINCKHAKKMVAMDDNVRYLVVRVRPDSSFMEVEAD